MATINKISDLSNKKVLVIFPHPDDETVMACGLILQALKVGAIVKVVCLTRGDQGKIHVHGRGMSLGEIRRQEFFTAMKRLGVDQYEVFNFPDGHLKKTKVWHTPIRELLCGRDLVVSYDPTGVTGHPDHITLTKYLHQLSRQRSFTFWQVAPIGLIKKFFVNHAVSGDLLVPQIQIRLFLLARLRKWWAFNAYRSQYTLTNRLLALAASFLPQVEGFAVYHPEKKYRFRYIPFEF
jgi:LmbE family N-acetylglucosaminyl deacetylase